MINSFGTHIKVKDFEKSKNFYLSLGFQPVFEYGPNTEVQEDYSGIVFQHGDCKLEIASGHRAVKPEIFAEEVHSSKISLMISVDSLFDIIEKAKASNIEIATPPRHYYWNTLEMVIKDPDGTVLVFIEPYTETSAKILNADETFSTKPA